MVTPSIRKTINDVKPLTASQEAKKMILRSGNSSKNVLEGIVKTKKLSQEDKTPQRKTAT
jgi:hypothetical protein